MSTITSEQRAREYAEIDRGLSEHRKDVWSPNKRAEMLSQLADNQICSQIDAVLIARQERKLREVLLTVIDDGDNGTPWGLDHPFESIADEQRVRFCDRVQERLRDLA